VKLVIRQLIALQIVFHVGRVEWTLKGTT